jgi:hypothetical protein
MKKLFALFALFACISSSYSQLNSNAEILKNDVTETYKMIKTFAEQNWKGDHSMMVYTINKQSDSFFEYFDTRKSKNYDEKILFNAMTKWHVLIDGVKIYNYSMIMYTYKKQLKAKKSY